MDTKKCPLKSKLNRKYPLNFTFRRPLDFERKRERESSCH